MQVGSLFSGVGGFDLGLEKSGMKTTWFAEIDSNCARVLAKNWPDVPNLGDVRNVNRRTAETVELICGGFPCQDLSVAGRRDGLAGEKSGLWYEFHRILTEFVPQWVLIENVPGLLNANEGKDFAILLGGLTGIIPRVPDDGWGNAGLARGALYKVAYRVFDSQFFGVAQQRRRVYIVANLRDGRAAKVLFESECSPVHIAESREKERHLARIVASHAERNSEATERTISWKKRGGFGWTQSEITTSTLEAAHNYQYVPVGDDIRRLTPVENERLHGFPDNWTFLPDMADGPRYKMMGNTVTVSIVEWIGRRIVRSNQ